MNAPHNLAAVAPKTGTARPALPTINPVQWEGRPAPKLQWLVDGWLLASGTTYVTGKGAVGKSLIAQQAMTCLAAGRTFLGQPVKQCRAAYVTAEDDQDELHRRQVAINEALGIGMGDLDGRLYLASLKGRDAALVSIGSETIEHPLLEELGGLINETGIECLALDNVAHLLAGNENDRHVVSSFLGYCDRLALAMGGAGGAVMLIGHSNKAGDQFSGSTAWENAVRSRLYIDQAPERGGYAQPDSRTLSRSKFNYGPKGDTLDFRWYKGAFIQDDDLPGDYAGELAQAAAIAQENGRFLDCLDAATRQLRNVSHAKGQNYAPKPSSVMTEARGMPVEGFARAMERLLHTGEILAEQKVVRSEKNRDWKYGLARAPDDARNDARNDARKAPETLPDTCTKPAPKAPDDAR